jgi:hypothetical protein
MLFDTHIPLLVIVAASNVLVFSHLMKKNKYAAIKNQQHTVCNQVGIRAKRLAANHQRIIKHKAFNQTPSYTNVLERLDSYNKPR